MNDIENEIIDNNELEEIAGKISNIQTLKKDFKPWHKPRKQWVRYCQWKNYLRSLLDENSYNDIKTIKYFSFPGEDCLDIKVLYEQCKEQNKSLYFQGIEADTIRTQAIMSQIMDLDGIDSGSTLHAQSTFEEISAERSSLFEKITSGSPYNIINLDFMNSIFSPNNGKETMQAICKIIDRQLNQQYLKWQLYITTRCNIGSINTEFLKDYITKLLDNCKHSDEFLNLIKQNICNTFNILPHLINLALPV